MVMLYDDRQVSTHLKLERPRSFSPKGKNTPSRLQLNDVRTKIKYTLKRLLSKLQKFGLSSDLAHSSFFDFRSLTCILATASPGFAGGWVRVPPVENCSILGVNCSNFEVKYSILGHNLHIFKAQLSAPNFG
jgi:hypothetical protein